MAVQLAEVLEAAWASDGLTLRRRALVDAVVARALGCEAAESEARRLLALAGMSEAASGAAVAQLSSPELDGAERAMVRLARESVWYRPVDVQRQARVAYEVLGPRIFLECVGTAALSNALCRLSMALADD